MKARAAPVPPPTVSVCILPSQSGSHSATGPKTRDPMNRPIPARFLLCARPALISARVTHPTKYSDESFSTEPAEAADAASSEAMTDNVVKRRSFIMIHPREVRQERAEARRLNGRNARAPAGAVESAPQPKTPRAALPPTVEWPCRLQTGARCRAAAGGRPSCLRRGVARGPRALGVRRRTAEHRRHRHGWHADAESGEPVWRAFGA